MNDAELLQEYASSGSEAAFRALVERHLPLVHSAALRQVGDPALAEDIAQAAFIILARKAGELSSGTILAGWLFRTTRHIAARAVRSEQRRRRREQEALQMQGADPNEAWQRLAPRLDEALAQLGEVDRNAVLLHYFEHKRLREVGLALGMSEDTAQKRISRAVEKLRKRLVKRGVALPLVVIPGLLMSHGAQAAPSHLGGTVTAAACGDAAISPPVIALLKKAFRDSPWPRVGRTLSKVGAILVVGGLAAYLWPKPGREGPAAYSFETTIVLRSLPFAPPPSQSPAPVGTPKLALKSASPIAATQAADVHGSPMLVTNLPVTNRPPSRPLLAKVDPPEAQAPALVGPGAGFAPPGASSMGPTGGSQVPYQMGYPPNWSSYPAAGRISPVFYANRARGAFWDQSLQEPLQPMSSFSSGPWMPIQKPSVPVHPRGSSTIPTKKQP
jgi:RNA polymerase sigma factor (sigma-70 family)